jgi:hypothetical protein
LHCCQNQARGASNVAALNTATLFACDPHEIVVPAFKRGNVGYAPRLHGWPSGDAVPAMTRAMTTRRHCQAVRVCANMAA